MIQDQTPAPDNLYVGDDKDEHGCIGSAGYIWCEKKQKCLRIWEENCYDNVQDQIRFLLSVRLGATMEDISIQIEKQDDNHVRGRYENISEKNTPEIIFLAVKIDEIWTIIYDGLENIDKSQVENYHFPQEMLEGVN